MCAYKARVIGNIICDKVSGELDAEAANKWVDELEKLESQSAKPLHRFHDVREINAVRLNFEEKKTIVKSSKSHYWMSHPQIPRSAI